MNSDPTSPSPSPRAPIELYGAPTGNCIRVAIALEEAALAYVVRPVNLRVGEHHEGRFLALNPAGKVPVIVDHRHGGAPLVLSQSNAILLYAAERAPGRLIPEAEPARATTFERFFFFVTDVIAPNHASFFLRAQDVPVARRSLDERAGNALASAERFASQSQFIAGDSFSIADIAAFTIAAAMKTQLPWAELPNLQRWFSELEGRSSIVRGYRALGASAG